MKMNAIMGRIRFHFYVDLYCIYSFAEDQYYGHKLGKILQSKAGLSKLSGHIFLLPVLTNEHPQRVAQTPYRLDTSLDPLSFMRNFCILVSACQQTPRYFARISDLLMSSSSYHRSVSHSGTICDANVTEELSQFITHTHTHTHRHKSK